jgi:predicted nuclease of predicted toxin-antitoxin system
MHLVLDQGVPRDAAALLRSLGYDCIHVSEIGMSKSTDEEILAFSLGRKAVVVTLDADFHTILAVSGAIGPSVIRVRLQGLGAPETVALVRKVLAGFEADLARGSLITVKARKTTCHRLPVGNSD